MSPPLAASKVVFASGHQLPGHLIRLLEDWHKDHSEEPPCASQNKKPLYSAGSDQTKVQKYCSSDKRELSPLEEIAITKPIRYNVYYLPMDGNGTGVLIKFLSSGSRRHFLKQWVGGYRFQPEPVAVRLTGDHGSFPPFPDEEMWADYTTRKLPNEFKEEGTENIPSSTIPKKRRRDRSREETESDLTSLSSSSGSDIPAQTKVRRPSNQFTKASSDDSSEEEEDEDEEDQAAPVGLSNGGLPIISRSRSHTDLAHRSPNAQRPARKSLSNLRSTRSPLVNTAGTASDSGIDLATSPGSSALPSIIKFKLLVPRTKMARDLRAENTDDNSEYIYNQARDFFRRYDRLLGSPILECVIEGESECKCIYNAKELGYFIEELRERRGIVKVTVTQSS